jgi:hypothetical protein
LRNACFGGYIIQLEDGAVVAQHGGVQGHNGSVELLRENRASDESTGPFGAVIETRLRWAATGDYICFNKCGHVISASSSVANSLGRQCVFVESVAPGHPEHLNMQSFFNPAWYLSFNGGKVVSWRRRKFTLPRQASCKKGSRRRQLLKKCDFKFSIGEFARHK